MAESALKDFNCKPNNAKLEDYRLLRKRYENKINTQIAKREEELKEYRECDNQARVLEAEILLKELYKERDEHMQLLTDL